MFQTILIGYDEPERGGEAIALAETLRGPHTGTLVLTSVCAPAASGSARPDRRLLLVARDALPDRDRVTIRTIPSDSAARALSETAELEHADLIVVGSSRRSARVACFREPPRSACSTDAPCPVAVAPRGYGGRDVRRIGVAHDGSPEADAALRAAESLAVELSAALTVYCVVEPGSPSRAATERARRLLHGVVENFSNADSGFGRFSYEQAFSFVPGGSPGFAEANAFGSNQRIRNHARNIALGETHVFNTNLINQATVWL